MEKNNDKLVEKTVFVTDDNGNKLEGEVIFTFEANGDNYVVYEIDGTAYSSLVDQEGNLSPIADDAWKLVEKVFEEYMEEHGDEELETGEEVISEEEETDEN